MAALLLGLGFRGFVAPVWDQYAYRDDADKDFNTST